MQCNKLPNKKFNNQFNKGGETRAREEKTPPNLSVQQIELRRETIATDLHCLRKFIAENVGDDEAIEFAEAEMEELRAELRTLPLPTANDDAQINKNEPPIDSFPIGEAWLREIKKSYPNTVYDEKGLQRIADECGVILGNVRNDLTLIEIIGFVASFGSEFLKDKFFETPECVVIRNIHGVTYIEEAARKAKDFVKRETRKFR